MKEKKISKCKAIRKKVRMFQQEVKGSSGQRMLKSCLPQCLVWRE